MSGIKKCPTCKKVSIPANDFVCGDCEPVYKTTKKMSSGQYKWVPSDEGGQLIWESSNTGVKHDQDKPDLSMLPRSAKIGIARAFMYGAKKYGRNNYKAGMNWTRLIAAADRHLSAFADKENLDEESNLNHLFHLGACVMMLIEYYEKGLGTDDR